MNCNSWQKLSVSEKIDMIGKLCHAIQNDEWSFSRAVWMMDAAAEDGVFDDVKINPGGFSTDEPMASGV